MEHIIKVSIFFENSQALFENFILPVQSSETVASVAEAIKGILISRHASDFRLRGDFDVEVFADTRPTRKTSFKPKKVASAFRNSGLFIEELMAKIGNIRDEESGFVIAIVKPDPRLVATLQSSHKVSQKSVIDWRFLWPRLCFDNRWRVLWPRLCSSNRWRVRFPNGSTFYAGCWS